MVHMPCHRRSVYFIRLGGRILREEVASGGLISCHSLLAKLNTLHNKQQLPGTLSEFIMVCLSQENGKRGKQKYCQQLGVLGN